MNFWWENYPWRMVQTNLREVDMENINAVRFVEDLKDFGATVVLLNAAGIIASYNSQLAYHPISKFLNGDSLKAIIDECHENGIRVIARTDFSKIRYEVYEKHPDWAYRTKEGKIVNYNGDVHTCPNGDYQRKYMLDILEEVLSTHPFDGVFCNMSGFRVVDYSYNYYGLCHCENCKRLFKEQYGLDLPENIDPLDAVYKKYMRFQADCEKNNKDGMRKIIKDINPQIAINGLDYIRCESNTEIGREQWQYSASSNSRVISGPNRLRPTDNASVDFMGFRYRHTSVSPALMELRQWQNLANSGCVSLYIMGRLDNHKDVSSFERTKKVFQFHKEHEDFYKGMESMAKVVVFRKAMWQVDPEVYGWIRALTESHVPFDELFLSEFNTMDKLKGKEVVILGDMRFLSDNQISILDEFVRNGGKVIATGETGLYNEKFLERPGMGLQCLGINAIKEKCEKLRSSIFEIKDEDKNQFTHCKEIPYIPFGENLVLVEPKKETKCLFRLIPEHPFGPPERCYFTEVIEEPGITVSDYGSGQGIYIPWMIGSFYRNEGYSNTLAVIKDILFNICGIEQIAPELTPMVEINICKKDDKRIIQLVNNSGVFANSYFDPLPVHNIKLKLKLVKENYSVETLNGGKVQFEILPDGIAIYLDKLNDYEAVIVS